MQWIRSLTFNVLYILWTIMIVIFCVPVLFLGYRQVIAVGRLWSRGSFWLLRTIVGLRSRIEGLENRPNGPAIYAVKHQSAWDTMAMAVVAIDAAYVLKRELIFIPIFGLYLLRSGFIPVDRQKGGAALRHMLRKARQVAAEGRSFVIYPEGTRVAPGQQKPYHPGVAALYTQLNLPVVPVALNSGLFWGRRQFIKRPGTITMRILPSISPGLGRHEFMRELHARIETAQNILRA